MEKFCIRWARLRSAYLERHSRFMRVVRRWEVAGWYKAARHARELLKDGDSLCAEISGEISSKGSIQNDVGSLEKKINRFAYIYKDLCWSTMAIWRQWAGIGGAVTAVVLVIVLLGFPRKITSLALEPNLLVGDTVWENRFALRMHRISHGDLLSFHDPECGCVNTKPSGWRKLANQLLFSGPCRTSIGRVVAIAGDRVEGVVVDGRPVVLVNGERIDDSHVNRHPLVKAVFPVGSKSLRAWCSYVPGMCLDKRPFYKLADDGIVLNDEDETGTLLLGRLACKDDLFAELTVPEGYFWVMGDNRRVCRDSRHWGPLHMTEVMGRVKRVLYSVDSHDPHWFLSLFRHPGRIFNTDVRWKRTFRRVV